MRSCSSFSSMSRRSTTLRTKNDALFLRLLQNDVLPRAELAAAATQLQNAFGELERILRQAAEELQRWQRQLEAQRKRGFSGPDAAEQKALYERKARLAVQIEDVLEESEQSLKDNRDKLATFLSGLDKTPLPDAVKALQDLANKEFRARLSEVFVAQTQIRVFLIELKPVDLTVNQAIQIALANRLDLKNALAVVTDEWRNVEVEANALKGFLNFVYTGNLFAAPGHTTLYRFDASASVHQFGLQFDAPINRRAERNAYRAGQITYQRARRAYMLLRDQIVQGIRLDMRNLLLSRKQFDIGREQLITTSRQVEEAEYALQRDPEGKPVTLNLLQALTALLSARNTLIGTWVTYETTRLNLYRDFDLMDIDSSGVWTNENDPQTIAVALRLATEHPAPSLAIPVRIPDLSGNESRGKAFFSDVRPSDRIIPDEAAGREGPLTTPELRDQPPLPPEPGATSQPVPPGTPSPFAPAEPGAPLGCRGFPAGFWDCSSAWAPWARLAISGFCRPGPSPRVPIGRSSRPPSAPVSPSPSPSAAMSRARSPLTASASSMALRTRSAILVPEGTKVKKGDVVCKFDGSEIQKNIAQQEIKYKQATARIETTQQEVEIQRNKGESDTIAATGRAHAGPARSGEIPEGRLPRRDHQVEG